MEIYNQGRVCIKTAGKDAGKTIVIIEKIDNTYVLIDGNIKRKKCNIKHLHPKEKTLDIKKSASTKEIHKAMTTAKLEVIPKKEKPQKDAKPRKTA